MRQYSPAVERRNTVVNALNEHELDAIYERYGFIRAKSNPFVRVYVTRRPFHFAEIVPLHDGVDTSVTQKGYQDANYATRVAHFANIDEARQHLFDTYFAPEDGRTRILTEHKRFVDEQSKMLHAQYRYVLPEFKRNAQDSEQGILDAIIDIIDRPGPQLVLVEAAAGFGKTCTAYELSRAIVEARTPRLPIMTELSRSRQARIFRYVLFDEIERSFPGLTYELVVSEVKTGRLPLIIDGFDELLSKAALVPTSAGGFDDVETMLDTISALLDGESKIVLNTRKTAIFAGDDFFRWLDSKANAFQLTRITLLPPTIHSWLGKDRAQRLARNGSPLCSLANPVILSFLRNLDDAKFDIVAADEERAITQYFEQLLDREQARQKLLISASRQREIFVDLSLRMAEFDITGESRDFIADLILSYNKDYLEEVRTLYPAAERPSIEDLARTLAGHALLDRVGRREVAVGFVNDFVLGVLFGDAFLLNTKRDWIPPDQHVSAAVTAFSARCASKREALLTRLEYYLDTARPEEQLLVEIQLRRVIGRTYSETTFDSISFTDISFVIPGGFRKCVFANCIFDRSKFTAKSFVECGFIACRFMECNFEGVMSENVGNWFRGCLSRGADIETLMAPVNSDAEPLGHEDEELELEIGVLQQFWPAGRASAQLVRAVRTLLLGLDKHRYAAVNRAIDRLRRKGLIDVNGDVSVLRVEQMAEIRRILGR